MLDRLRPVFDLGRADAQKNKKDGWAEADGTLAKEGPATQKNAEDEIMVRRRTQRVSDIARLGPEEGAKKRKALAGKGKNKKTEGDTESDER